MIEPGTRIEDVSGRIWVAAPRTPNPFIESLEEYAQNAYGLRWYDNDWRKIMRTKETIESELRGAREATAAAQTKVEKLEAELKTIESQNEAHTMARQELWDLFVAMANGAAKTDLFERREDTWKSSFAAPRYQMEIVVYGPKGKYTISVRP